MENAQIIETVTYRTKDGVSDAEYIKTSPALNAFTARIGGAVSRNLFKDADGLWHEQTVWADAASHQKAMKGFMASEEGQAIVALLDPETLKMSHARAAYADIHVGEMA